MSFSDKQLSVHYYICEEHSDPSCASQGVFTSSAAQTLALTSFERSNGTLKAMLKTFVGEHVQVWDRHLPYFLFAYREVQEYRLYGLCESTGYSPFVLLQGRTVRDQLASTCKGELGRKETRGRQL